MNANIPQVRKVDPDATYLLERTGVPVLSAAAIDRMVAKLKLKGLLPEGEEDHPVTQIAPIDSDNALRETETLEVLDLLRKLKLKVALSAFLQQLREPAQLLEKDLNRRLAALFAHELVPARTKQNVSLASSYKLQSVSPREHDGILHQFGRLGLQGMAREWQTQQRHVTKESFERRLIRLLQSELRCRRPSSERRRAGVPLQAQLEEPPKELAPRLQLKTLKRLAALRWTESREFIWICGEQDAARTWLASAIACKALEAGLSVVYTPAEKIERSFKFDKSRNNRSAFINRLLSAELLVVDAMDVTTNPESELWSLVIGRCSVGSTVIVSEPSDEKQMANQNRALLRQAIRIDVKNTSATT